MNKIVFILVALIIPLGCAGPYPVKNTQETPSEDVQEIDETDVDLPSTGDDIETPPAGDEVEEPGTGEDPEEPTEEDGVEDPNTEEEAEEPNGEAPRALPPPAR